MRKELDLLYSPRFDRGGDDAMKHCLGRSPVEAEFVCAQCLFLEFLCGERRQRMFREWNTISEDFIGASGAPNYVLLRYEIKPSGGLGRERMRISKTR